MHNITQYCFIWCGFILSLPLSLSLSLSIISTSARSKFCSLWFRKLSIVNDHRSYSFCYLIFSFHHLLWRLLFYYYWRDDYIVVIVEKVPYVSSVFDRITGDYCAKVSMKIGENIILILDDDAVTIVAIDYFDSSLQIFLHYFGGNRFSCPITWKKRTGPRSGQQKGIKFNHTAQHILQMCLVIIEIIENLRD